MNRRSHILEKLSHHFAPETCTSYASILFEDIPDINNISAEDLDLLLDRIIDGEPIQYVTGIAPFYGHFFNVDSRVLIPRPETEELVYAVEKYIKKHRLDSARIIDIGTGSGCIPITVHKLFPVAQVFGLDVSKEALEVAKSNNSKLGSDVTFKQFDFTDDASWNELGEFDIIVSNPPYIPHKEKSLMSANVLDHEPHLALFVENEDPLLFYRKTCEFAQNQNVRTAVFLECNEFNAEEVVALFSPAFETEIIQDLQGKDRIVKAMKESGH